MLSTDEIKIQTLVDRIQQSFTQNEVSDVLQDTADKLGFDYFTYARLFPKAITRLDIIALGNYPDEWLQEYVDKKYIFVDPTIKHCTSSTLPYFWRNIYLNNNESVKKFAAACSSFGLKDGFSIGINGNCGDYSIISFGGGERDTTIYLELEQAISIAHILLPYLHEKLAQIEPVRAIYPTEHSANPNIPLSELTHREKECLLWTAEGKTSHEISLILNVSESTVNFHLKNAVLKLDCINKTHAVAKAVLLGLITNLES